MHDRQPGRTLPGSLVALSYARAALLIGLAVMCLIETRVAGMNVVRVVGLLLWFEGLLWAALLSVDRRALPVFRPWLAALATVNVGLGLLLAWRPDAPHLLNVHAFSAASLLTFMAALLPLLVFASLTGRSSWGLFAWSFALGVVSVTLHMERMNELQAFPVVDTTFPGVVLLLAGVALSWALPKPVWARRSLLRTTRR